jgi:hypothetical protein
MMLCYNLNSMFIETKKCCFKGMKMQSLNIIFLMKPMLRGQVQIILIQ